MRGVLWVVLLFAVAVVAAMTLGTNDSLVTLNWRGWRVDLSLNLFLLLLVGGYFFLAATLRGIEALVSLPRRAGEWRRLQRERAVHAHLRDAQFELAEAMFARARRAGERVALTGASDWPGACVNGMGRAPRALRLPSLPPFM